MTVSSSSRGLATAVYKGDRAERDLVIIIDADTVSGDPEKSGISDLLLGLATYEHVKMYRYADDGPPPGTPTLDLEFWKPAAIGWLVCTESEPEAITSHSVTYSDGKQTSNTAIIAGLVSHFTKRLEEASPGPSDARLERDSLLLLAASTIGADILVTARPSLLRGRPFDTPTAITIATPADAIPLLGLYMRTRGDYFATKTARSAFTFSRGLYWQRASSIYAPALPNVVARAMQLAQTRRTPVLERLALATRRRLARVLERRDGIWRLINQTQDQDVAEDLLTAVDSLLTFLMSASDALAKVADAVLVTNVSPANIGWQKKDWLKAIAKKDSVLAALFVDSAQPAQAIEVLRLLRNCIHDEGLDAVAVHVSSRRQETWIIPPTGQATAITNAMLKRRPLDEWGVHAELDGSVYAEIGRLIETLLIEVLAALSSVLERLGQILEPMTTNGQSEPKSQLNEALLSLHIQWQVGLGQPLPQIG